MKKNTNVRRTKEEVEFWYNEHVNNSITLVELSIKYNTDAHYQFKKFGFKPKTLSNIRRINRYKILNFLEKSNNDKDAYILGLFFSDGSITKENNFRISLKNSDEYLLNDIKNYMAPSTKLHNDKKNKVLIICSMNLINNLKQIGATTRKTYDDFSLYEIAKKSNMNEIFYRDFIRGYFDGDGTIFYDKNYLRVNICSISKQILVDIQEILKKNGIISSINEEIRKGKSFKLPQGNMSSNCKNMYRLFIRQKKSLLLLYNYLYDNNPSFYLKRKHEVFNKYVNIELT